MLTSQGECDVGVSELHDLPLGQSTDCLLDQPHVAVLAPKSTRMEGNIKARSQKGVATANNDSDEHGVVFVLFTSRAKAVSYTHLTLPTTPYV